MTTNTPKRTRKGTRKGGIVESIKLRTVTRRESDQCEFELDAGVFQAAQVKAAMEGVPFGEWLNELLVEAVQDVFGPPDRIPIP